MAFLQARTTKVLLSGVLFFVACGFADVITVKNPSFETVPAGGLPIPCALAPCRFSQGSIPGWMSQSNPGAESGQLQPGSNAGNTNLFNTIPDGITIAYSNGGTISQDVGVTVEPFTMYTLMVDLGFRKTPSAQGEFFRFTSAALLAGATPVATAIGVPPTQGNWSTYTASFIGSAADVGKPITIQLTSTGAQGSFDDVRLTSQFVPEPASIGAVGFGLAGLLAFARRKRRA